MYEVKLTEKQARLLCDVLDGFISLDLNSYEDPQFAFINAELDELTDAVEKQLPQFGYHSFLNKYWQYA